MVRGSRDVWGNYFALRGVRAENETLRRQLGELEVKFQQEHALAVRSGVTEAYQPLPDLRITGQGDYTRQKDLFGTLGVTTADERVTTGLTTPDTSGNVGASQTSITVGTDGFPLISYFDTANANLVVAHCSTVTCSSATTTALDSTGNVGQDSSIAIGADGLGLVSYRDATNVHLKVAHCADVACSSATAATTLDSGTSVGGATSVTVGADGRGLVGYFDNGAANLKVAHCSDVACTAATAATVDSATFVGEYASISVGIDGLGVVSYWDHSSALNLKVAHCVDVACSAATTTVVDSPNNVGSFSSLAIGADGLPLVTYRDVTNNGVRVAHCPNVFCVGYLRRR